VPARDRTSLGILAGGRGRRLGGVDKAFVAFQGQPLLDRVLAAAGAGFAETLVSHNAASAGRSRHEGAGRRFVADAVAAGEGPLAGLDALLQAASSDWLLTLPVDARAPTPALVGALLREDHGAVLRDADGLQPLAALWPVPEARAAVRAALEQGERAVHPLVSSLGMRLVDVSPARLGNLNTPQDFEDRE
jgi:molybdopterin-guanine dinucleotide biosynthesis protein A